MFQQIMPEDDSWMKHEADMGAEAMHGKPIKRSAEQGIKDMRARIKMLQDSKDLIVSQLETNPLTTEELAKQLSEINQGIKEAKDRLREYELQKQSKN